jgi:hypothetical protein
MSQLHHRSPLPFYVIGAVASIYLLPLWSARYLVAQDLPAHVELGCQILHVWRGDPDFTSVLFLRPQPWPNSLPNILLAGLLALVPSFTAAKIALSLYVIAWPLSVALLLKSFNRSPWLALLCLPTTLDMGWSFGFFNFVMAKPVFCIALAAARGAAVKGGLRRGIGLAGALTLLFTCHSLIWLVALGCSGLILLLRAPSLSKSIARAWPLAVTGLASVPFFAFTFTAPKGAFNRTTWQSPALAISTAWENLGSMTPTHGDEIAWSAALLALFFVIITAKRSALREGGRDRLVLIALTVVTIAAYLFGPTELPGVQVVAQRVLGFSVVLACACAPNPRRLAVPALALGMTAAAALHALDASRSYRAFSASEMGNFEELLGRAPPRGRIATHFQWTTSPYGPHNAAWHWPKLYCLTGHGFTDDMFSYGNVTVIAVRPEARAAGFVMPLHRMQPAVLARYTALLTRGNAAAERPIQGALKFVGAAGSWRLSTVEARRPVAK